MLSKHFYFVMFVCRIAKGEAMSSGAAATHDALTAIVTRQYHADDSG
jgi:hypothetical protein